MASEEIISNMIESSPNRRKFVQKLGLAGAILGAVTATEHAEAQSAPATTDADILNFALNLEYLEAEFYTFATSGGSIDQLGINISGTGNLGVSTGGAPVSFSISDTTVSRAALELAANERTHVTLLRAAIVSLGALPIARPPINLAALGFGFANPGEFLKLARIFEDLGVTAYGGAAPLIKNSSILGYAARILATEALHAGTIRSMIDRYNVSTTAFDGADHLPPPIGSQFFTTDSNAITEIRTPAQVLFVAYGGPNVLSGGFFPNGVNGIINRSSASPATSDGTFLTASPNPIRVGTGILVGITTLSWNAPAASVIQIHVNSPTGPLLTTDGPAGSVQTNAWVVEGMTFYLQDVSGGKALIAANTLATVTAHLGPQN